MTNIQGVTPWVGGTTPPPGDISSAKEPGAFDLFAGGLERIVTDLATTNGKDGKSADTLFNTSGAPQLAPPEQTPDQYQPPLSLEQLMAESEILRGKFNSSLINEQANESYNSMKQRIDKHVDAQLRSIDELQKASDELTKKLNSWFYKAVQWASDNLGPIFPFVGLAIAGVMTLATGGAAWPLLALAVANVANHVLKQNGIDVIAKVESGISKVMTPVIGKEAAKNLAKQVSSGIGLVVGDPTPVGEFFGKMFADIAKLLGAGKSTVEACEMAGKILGAVAVALVGVIAGGGGSAVANAMTSALTAIRAAVTAPVETAKALGQAAWAAVKQFFDLIVRSVQKMAQNGAETISSAVQAMAEKVMASLREFFNALRDAIPRLKQASESFLRGPHGIGMPRIQDAAKFVPSLADLQGLTAQYSANLARSVSTGVQAGVGFGSSVRDGDLAFSQKKIDETAADRNKMDQVVSSVRQEMEAMDQAAQRRLATVGGNAKASASTIRDYVQGALERARLQNEQMVAA